MSDLNYVAVKCGKKETYCLLIYTFDNFEKKYSGKMR